MALKRWMNLKTSVYSKPTATLLKKVVRAYKMRNFIAPWGLVA